MRKPHIYEGDKGIDYDLFYEGEILEYNGLKFTGTLIENDSEPKSYSEFKNGEYDGDSISYFENGKLLTKGKYKNGNCIYFEHWYPNGQLREKIALNRSTKWTEDGIMAYRNGVLFYNNGKIKRGWTDENEEIINNSKENIAISIKSINNSKTRTFYHKNLIEDYQEMLIELYPELDFNKFAHSQIKINVFYWINQIYFSDSLLAESLLKNLFSHQTNDVQNFAKHLFSLIEKKKNDVTEKTYWFEKENERELHQIVY